MSTLRTARPGSSASPKRESRLTSTNKKPSSAVSRTKKPSEMTARPPILSHVKTAKPQQQLKSTLKSVSPSLPPQSVPPVTARTPPLEGLNRGQSPGSTRTVTMDKPEPEMLPEKTMPQRSNVQKTEKSGVQTEEKKTVTRKAPAKTLSADDTQREVVAEHFTAKPSSAGATPAVTPGTTPTGQSDQVCPIDILITVETSCSEDLLSARCQPFRTTTNDTKPAVDYSVKKWYHIRWNTVVETVCLVLCLLDPSLVDLLSEYARGYGGYCFLVCYVLAVFLLQMPLSFLLIHLGQHTQTGLAYVTQLYGPIYRGIGVAMWVWLLLSQAQMLNSSAEKLDHALHIRPLLDEFTRCKMKDIDCRTNLRMSSCCVSVVENRECALAGTSSTTDGDYCKQDISLQLFAEPFLLPGEERLAHGVMRRWEDRMMRPPSYFFWKSEALDGNYRFGEWRSFITTCTISLISALAVAGLLWFSRLYSCLGLITVVILLANGAYLIGTGSPAVGVRRLYHQSDPQRLFSFEAVYALFHCVVAPVNLKFFVVSMGAMRSRKADAFTTSLTQTLVQLGLCLFYLVVNLAMTGRLEQTGQETAAPTSITSAAGHAFRMRKEYWGDFLPEYFGVFDMPIFYVWFSVSHFLLHLLPIMAAYYTVLDPRSLFGEKIPAEMPRIVRNAAAALGLGGVLLFLCTLIQCCGNAEGRMYGSMHCMGVLLLLLFNEVTVRIYGENEFLLDLCFIYPITDTFHDHFGPLSGFFRSLQRVVIPLVLSFLTLTLYNADFVFDYQQEVNSLSLAVEAALSSLPLMTLFGFFVLDVVKVLCCWLMRDQCREIWKMVHLSREHPSYKRIMHEETAKPKLPDEMATPSGE